MWILSPLSWLLIAALAWCLAPAGERGRRARRASGALALVAVVAMTPLAANLLVGWLESPRPSPPWCAAAPPRMAVVLAGAVDFAPGDPQDFAALNIASRRRTERAVAWWQAETGRSLVIAGGPSANGNLPVSALMAGYAARLGAASSAIETEGVSTTTWGSAQELARVRLPATRRVVLITSAMHMPRARYAMERAGFEVCGLASDSRLIPFGFPGYLIPRSSALEKTEAALHEWIGMLYYRLRAAGVGVARDRKPAPQATAHKTAGRMDLPGTVPASPSASRGAGRLNPATGRMRTVHSSRSVAKKPRCTGQLAETNVSTAPTRPVAGCHPEGAEDYASRDQPGRADCNVEPRRCERFRVHARRDRRQVTGCPVHCGRPRPRYSATGAGYRVPQGQGDRLPLAPAQGWIAVLGRRGHAADLRDRRPTVRVRQDPARRDRLRRNTGTLAGCGLAPSFLAVELTERKIFESGDTGVAILLDLRARGVAVAIDDFGKGYSSLSYL